MPSAHRNHTSVNRRRFMIIKALFRSELQPEQLIAEVNQQMGGNGFPPNDRAALAQDLSHLRQEFQCQISFEAGIYRLEALGDFAFFDHLDSTRVEQAISACIQSDEAQSQRGLLQSVAQRLRLLLGGTRHG